MIHQYISRGGRHALRLAAIMSLLAAIDFSNRGWAFIVSSPPSGDDIKFVAASCHQKGPGGMGTTSQHCKSPNLVTDKSKRASTKVRNVAQPK
jgi:hypothetical protein